MESNVDRKRRQFSSISPTAVAKKQSAFAVSEDKKLDVGVLQYRNRKLKQQMETLKVEYSILESKICHLKDKQISYDDTIGAINKSWEQLVDNLEQHCKITHGYENDRYDMECSQTINDGTSAPTKEDFMSKTMKTGATESCSDVLTLCQTGDAQTSQATTRHILQNIQASIDCLWHANSETVSNLCSILPEDEHSKQLQKSANDTQLEIQSFQLGIRDLHSKHQPLAEKVQYNRDMDAKNKAEHKGLESELESAISELDEINCKIAHLKTQKDAAAFQSPIFFPMLGSKPSGGDKFRDKETELKDLESSLKNMKDLASSRLVEIRNLHEGRIDILKKLADIKNAVTDVQSIISSPAFLSLCEQLDKSKAEMDLHRTSIEKLQVEKDTIIWHEKEVTLKADLADVYQRLSAFSESHRAQLELDLQKLQEGRTVIESKLEQASKEPGMKEIMAEFKSHISSLSKDMSAMQKEIIKYKASAPDLHILRSEVQSLSSLLDRKVSESDSLSNRSSQQLSEIKKLQKDVQKLRKSDHELRLFIEMYKRESTDSRAVMESRDMEYNAWARVQSLKSSLDDHNLELRVKEANEAESISQQRLATTEAEIADLRHILESSKRDIYNLSETLKSKREEGEAFLSEIESIGQAYEDIQTQNQHLLQQITERDEYNTKLVLEVLRARQRHDSLSREVHTMEKKIQSSNLFLDLFTPKVNQLEEKLKICSDQVSRLVEEKLRNSNNLSDAQRKLTDVEREYEQIKQSLSQRQSKCAKSRLEVAELLIELEKERFEKMRIEEELEVMSRKAESLRKQMEGSSMLGKLKQEIREYRGILKCRVCHDRQKEVVIAKCYHLFCSQCIQKILSSRHKKCPTCNVSFGANDVKPIYI